MCWKLDSARIGTAILRMLSALHRRVLQIIAAILLLLDLSQEPGSALSYESLDDNDEFSEICTQDDFWWTWLNRYTATADVLIAADADTQTTRLAVESVAGGDSQAVSQSSKLPRPLETSILVLSSAVECAPYVRRSLIPDWRTADIATHIAHKLSIVLLV